MMRSNYNDYLAKIYIIMFLFSRCLRRIYHVSLENSNACYSSYDEDSWSCDYFVETLRLGI